MTPARINGAFAVFNLVGGLVGLIGVGGIEVMNFYKGVCVGMMAFSIILLTANLAIAIIISKEVR